MIAHLAHRLRNGLVPRTYCLYGVAVEAAPAPEATTTTTRTGALEDLRAWRESRIGLPAPFSRDQTEGWGHFCWAWVGTEPVGIAWITHSSPLIRMQPHEAAIVDLYAVPTFRRRGIGTALISAACVELRRLGVRRGYATVESGNVPSRRAFEAAGFQLLGSFTSVRLLDRRPSTRQWSDRLSISGCGDARRP